MKTRKITFVIFAAFFAYTAGFVEAQSCPPLISGCLDVTFGSGGMIITNVDGFSRVGGLTKTLIQSDGKILDLRDVHADGPAGVTNILIRHKADGSIDYGFGSAGVVYMNWNGPSGSYGNANDIALQSVGGVERIVVAGYGYGGNSTLRVDRYDENGNADASFGSNGSAFFSTDYALAVAVQPDGKIVTVGPGSLVRLTVGGALDSGFGSRGIAQTTVISGWQVAVQSDGRILVVGQPYSGTKNNLIVARFNANGSLDDGSRKDPTPSDAFGSGGKVSLEFFSKGYSNSIRSNSGLQVDASGNIIVAGFAWRTSSDNNKDFAVARLTSSGKFDSTFAGDGKATFDLSGMQDTLRGVDVQNDGKILLSGLANVPVPTNRDMALVRLNSNGTLDATFGIGGVQINNYSNEDEGNYLGLIQSDPACLCEKIVVTGQLQLGGKYSAFAARYLE